MKRACQQQAGRRAGRHDAGLSGWRTPADPKLLHELPPVSADDVSSPLSRPVIGSTYERLSPTSPAAMLPPRTPPSTAPSPPSLAAPVGAAASEAHLRAPACSATAAPATAAANAAAMSCSRSASQLPAAALDTDARCCAATAASAAARMRGCAANARMVGPPLSASAGGEQGVNEAWVHTGAVLSGIPLG